MKVISYVQHDVDGTWVMRADGDLLKRVAATCLGTDQVSVEPILESDSDSDFWLEADGRKLVRKFGAGSLADFEVYLEDEHYLLTLQEN